MKNFETIQKLLRNSAEIEQLFSVKIPKWKGDPSHYDKTGYGFNLDDRFQAIKPVLISFDSWMGTYGNSGSSRQCTLDSEIFATHLLKYLNGNKETIMLDIAKRIRDEAKLLKQKAEEEVQKQFDLLKELES